MRMGVRVMVVLGGVACLIVADASLYPRYAAAQESARADSSSLPPGALVSPPPLCMPEDARVEVMLLGSYHMANPGLDAFNLQADDVTSPVRQAEIEALVNRLAAFRPTRVAIEAPLEDSASWQAAYIAYRSGQRALQRNEREQIGFRLAAQLGHEHIYAVDVALPLNSSALAPLAQQNAAHGQRLAELQRFGEQAIATMAAWLEEGTISDMLYRMNHPSTLHLAHMPYAKYFLPIKDGSNYAGADLVASWYQRNLRILANMHASIESEADRVFVVYGQGHIPLLRQFVVDSPELCVVDPLPFLIDGR